MKICPMAKIFPKGKNISQIKFKIFPITECTLTRLPNIFKILPNCRNFAKSGHTGLTFEPLTYLRTCLRAENEFDEAVVEIAADEKVGSWVVKHPPFSRRIPVLLPSLAPAKPFSQVGTKQRLRTKSFVCSEPA